MTAKFFDLANPNFVGIMWRFIIHLVFLFILIRVIYFKYSGKEKFLFSFFLMGILTFFITSMLRSVTIEMGMAVGLFAVLGILRLRARNFGVKDMAYTFATLGISVINALKVFNFPLLGILIINVIIILSAYILEQFLLKNKTETHSIIYENLELLRPEKKQKLLRDVSSITGKEILKIKIRRIDYKNKVALLDISYKD
jgi:hypothetical protein